jgi:deoxyribodipyrimidine photo-lyase
MATKEKINVVWLKRDLRSQDHLPLFIAEESGLPYLIIFVFEPSIMAYPDTSLRHLQFQYHSILQLNKKLSVHNKEVVIFNTDIITVLDTIQTQYSILTIFSYQETGIQLTYDRDKMVQKYCKTNNIEWKESQRDGIVRGIKNREGWDKQWYANMNTPVIVNKYKASTSLSFQHPYPLSNELLVLFTNYPNSYQPAGEDFAFKYLQTFISGRGQNYSRHISKPHESRVSCGRISPYLSWGNISVKQAYQYINNAAKETKNKTSFANMLTRLKWHCHFIQKFEVDCSYETKCINAGYELLEHSKNIEYINAWKEAKTGFPLVDACMKCLQETGWINFRMRAMLVSFFCHHLYQDWRDATYHLAQLFLDYEPGIHFTQFQMQAGTTGINTIRMYNPIKQSLDHDPEGVFIKKWLPELRPLPTEYLHEPYKMSLMEQEMLGVIIGKDYPYPIVAIVKAGKEAREKIWGHKSHALVRQENKRILSIHCR